MKPNNVTLPSLYFQQVVGLLTESNVDVAQLLRGIGLRPEDLKAETTTLGWQELKAFLLEAARYYKGKSLGFLIGERLLINMHGSLGNAAMSGGSIRQVIDLIARFLELRIDLMRLEVLQQDDHLTISLVENHSLGELRKILTEAIVLAIRNVLDFITLGVCPITEVYFPFEGDPERAQPFFGCPVKYQHTKAGFSIPIEPIDKPLKLANRHGFQTALRICEEELEKITQTKNISYRIRKIILQSSHGFPSLDMIASRLNMSPRTLHRRLKEESTSYRDILENVRQQLAKRYLDEQTMSIQEIAYALGYAEISNFRKAFKRWYGMPPSQYQKTKPID
jgi:AraC-like DNA-binding protein